jgi:hypothetical protein
MVASSEYSRRSRLDNAEEIGDPGKARTRDMSGQHEAES